MKTLDTRAYVSLLKEAVEEGHEASMTIVGSSMAPFLCHNRDRIFFSAPKSRLKRGDMAFFQRESGQYVMHRIVRVKKEGFYFMGDNQTVSEGPVAREKIFARIDRIERKGKIIQPGDFWWWFFKGPWLWLRPVRRPVAKLYGLLSKGQR